MAGADRFDRALLSRRKKGASTLLVGDHAAHALFGTERAWSAWCATLRGQRLRWIGCARRALSSSPAAPNSTASLVATGATNAMQSEVFGPTSCTHAARTHRPPCRVNAATACAPPPVQRCSGAQFTAEGCGGGTGRRPNCGHGPGTTRARRSDRSGGCHGVATVGGPSQPEPNLPALPKRSAHTL
jgi:hypothetical protein